MIEKITWAVQYRLDPGPSVTGHDWITWSSHGTDEKGCWETYGKAIHASYPEGYRFQVTRTTVVTETEIMVLTESGMRNDQDNQAGSSPG